jgi:hypothetical protein
LPAIAGLTISRAFVFHVPSGNDTPNSSDPVINTLRVPFCGACLDLQRLQHKPPSPWTALLRIACEGEGLAGAGATVIGCLFLASGFKHFSVAPLLLAGLSFSLAFWLMRTAWNKNPQMGVPAPTAVDLAVDFTPYLNLQFEPAWRAFQFRSPQYAVLFRQANAHQLWNPYGAEADVAASRRKQDSFRTNLIIGAVMVVALLWSLWHELSPH